MYVYHALNRCSSCGLPTHLNTMKDYTSTIPTITNVYKKMDETDINKQLSNIYSQPNERFLNPKRHYKGVKNSEAKTQ